jgi:hypothetical protein
LAGHPFGLLSKFRPLSGKGQDNPPIEKWASPEVKIIKRASDLICQNPRR